MRRPLFAKTKAQINCAVSAFVSTTGIVQFLFFLNPKFRDIFCSCKGRFVSDMIGNPEDRFSGVAAQMIYDISELINKSK